jgi:hypothetical protein
VDEHVLAAIIGRDEAVAFGGIEPFHGAGGHIRGLLCLLVRPRKCGGMASVW